MHMYVAWIEANPSEWEESWVIWSWRYKTTSQISVSVEKPLKVKLFTYPRVQNLINYIMPEILSYLEN